MSSESVPPASAEASPPRRSLLSTLLKVAVTLGLYVLVFYKIDFHDFWARLQTARVGWVALGVLAYAAGQWLSAWRWWVLLRPVQLTVPYLRMVAFYFIGMFFNFFLPTIVGGDAVKAILLARETGAPARATMSVFMERNVGLLALLAIATIAAVFAPPVAVKGVSLLHLTLLLFAGFIVANVVLADRRAYHVIDYLVAMTPLARISSRAASLYDAVVPYRERRWWGLVAATIGQSFLFQGVVILVVFLNANALDQHVPVAALAVFVPLISLAGMLPISVNGLGIREALYLLLFGRIGVPADVAVSLAVLYSVVTFAASLPGGVVYALQRGPGIRAGRSS
ncbi:MAG: lysylphosphatidylglycerol synthase transmembrane domain-containing protein [Acidobacteria bacterium]|nr:lysylphosphatidylglycerol synthase transmembrane domain-containing protein [Acidobacteriota bacterium]